jgi:hypothetical protein
MLRYKYIACIVQTTGNERELRLGQPHLYKTEDSSPHEQELATCPYPWPPSI